MDRAGKLKTVILDWAKAIHEAIGIESPKLFIGLFAVVGLLLFGLTGWVIDRGYRVRLREQIVHAAPSAPAVTQSMPTSKPQVHTVVPPSAPPSSIEQHSTGANSPNITTGDNSPVDIK
jgi:hypothetical protein